jgi:hypothetical protein
VACYVQPTEPIRTGYTSRKEGTMLKKNLFAVGILTVCFSVLSGGSAHAIGSAVSALPADATLVVKFTKLKETYDKLMASPPGQLIQKGEFKDLLDKVREEFEKARAQVKAELDIDLWEALQLIEGELLFFLGNASETFQSFKTISEAESEGDDAKRMTEGLESLPFLVIADAESAGPKLKKIVDALTKYAGEKGAQVESAEFHGGDITAIRKTGAGHGYLGKKDSRFIFGFNRKLVEQTLVNLGSTTGGDGLTGNAVYQTTYREAKGGSSDVFAYLNMKQIADAVGPAIAGEMPAAMIWESLRGLLLGNSLNSFGIGGALSKDGLRQTTFVHNEGASDGIFGWFKGTAFPSTPPSLIPSEAGTFSTLAFNGNNFGNFVRNIAQLFAMFQGGGPGAPSPDVNALAKSFIGVELDELLRAIGGRIHFFGSATADPENPLAGQTIAIELSDENTIKTVVETLKNFAPGVLEDKEYMGSTIHRAGEGGPALSVTHRMFVLSFAPGGIEKLIRRMGTESASSLADSAEYKRMAASIPSSVTLLNYTDSKYMGQSLGNLVDMVMTKAPEEIPEEAFLFLAALGRTLGASIGFGTWVPTGLYFESVLQFQAGG